MFVITRWQSKHKMLGSLFANKDLVVAMCSSEDPDCAILRDENVALTDSEWKVIKVRFLILNLSTFLLYHFAQESLPLFEKLAAVSKIMEGENYILSSSYWGALHEIEVALQRHIDDSPTLLSLRMAMFNDHFSRRVTLDQSVENPLHVLMHLLDPRFVIFPCA